MKAMIEAGAAGVHFEDQLASEKKCGHLGGKVLVPTAASSARSMRRASRPMSGRADARSSRAPTPHSATLHHQRRRRARPALHHRRTDREGFFRLKQGNAIRSTRSRAGSPMRRTPTCSGGRRRRPDLGEAREFAEEIHAQFPGKLLAYNCSPSFNWRAEARRATIANFQASSARIGYGFQFVTLAGFHALNFSMFELAAGIASDGMAAYSRTAAARVRGREERLHRDPPPARGRHRLFRCGGDGGLGGKSATSAMAGSTETAQFERASPAAAEVIRRAGQGIQVG